MEGGEIIYDGKDLLKISEEEMCKIRGDEISMIFQDPLSSLNPIVKIGKQITEAMLLKNKTSRREAKKEFNSTLELLCKNIAAATGNEAQAKELTGTFDKFCIEANKLELSYNDSASAAEALVSSIEDFLFRTSKNQKLDVKATLKEYRTKLKNVKDPFFVAHYADRLNQLSEKLTAVSGDYQKGSTELPESIASTLKELEKLLSEMQEQVRPDFFRIGFYALKNPGENLSGMDYAQLNEQALKYLDDNFMKEFIQVEMKGVERSFQDALEKKRALMPALQKAREFFSGDFD